MEEDIDGGESIVYVIIIIIVNYAEQSPSTFGVDGGGCEGGHLNVCPLIRDVSAKEVQVHLLDYLLCTYIHIQNDKPCRREQESFCCS